MRRDVRAPQNHIATMSRRHGLCEMFGRIMVLIAVLGSGGSLGAAAEKGIQFDPIIELPKFEVTDSRLLPPPSRGTTRKYPASKFSRGFPNGRRSGSCGTSCCSRK
jgi:hypothetical protein